QRLVALPALPQLGGDLVQLLVLGDQRIDISVVDRIHYCDQVVDAPGVHGDAEAQLRLGLVALGDGDAPHVVAEAGELQRVHLGPAGRGAGPAADLGLHALVARVAHDGLAVHAQAGGDVAELAVAVRGLVEVHEVHVDRGPGQLDVRLGVQVQQRGAQRIQALDPHLRGGEGVHQGDDAHAGRVRVPGQGDLADRVTVGEHRLPEDLHRDVARGIERLGDGAGLLGDLDERLGAVQALAAGQEPDLACGEGVVHEFSSTKG